MFPKERIRNFAIVAHVDHGKSTLADRMLEITGTIAKRDMTDQVLDSNPIERERGITIKLAPVRMLYRYRDQEYILNLIDTPGHVDFSYEVSRSLSACEGIILVVDASQNIQAQTLSHMQSIRNRGLSVIPVINKIDLPTAKIQETRNSLKGIFQFTDSQIIEASAKSGKNVEYILASVVNNIPHPHGDPSGNLQVLVFSSKYDQHRGVVLFVKIENGYLDIREISKVGSASKKNALRFIASGKDFTPLEIGYFSPKMTAAERLDCGMVGYIATGLKDLSQAKTGDTIVRMDSGTLPLPGYREPKPMVYLGVFPVDTNQFLLLKDSLDKLHLTDSSFSYKPYSSMALGKGFLCGFLGLLHAEIVSERLEKEFSLNIITCSPTVEYEIILKNKCRIFIHSPDEYPDPSQIILIREPVMTVTIYTPSDSLGRVMQLCERKRSRFLNLEYIFSEAKLTYRIPLSEMIIDFFDNLKSVSSGYASLDYDYYGYQDVDAVKMDIYLNHQIVDAFSVITVRDNLNFNAEKMVNKLKELIPKHQFQVPIQAAVGGKIIARSDIKAFRKDVTQKLYGGDQSRKDKLLEAQKKGKKKMKQIGRVEIPQYVFLKVFREEY